MVQRNALVEILICLFFTVGAESAPAKAQSTNAAPNLSKSNIPYNADKAPGLPAEAKKAVTDAQAKIKSGDLLA